MSKEKIIITKIEVVEFNCELGRSSIGDGSGRWRILGGIRIHTNLGITGEYIGRHPSEYSGLRHYASTLIGLNPLRREKIYTISKLATRQIGFLSMGVLDIALWDVAGKYYEAPIYELLGGYRKKLPSYASTYQGEFGTALGTPESYAEFAVQCKELGYPGFKIHPIKGASIDLDIETVLSVRSAVGSEMDLMIDPACNYNTFLDALKVGRACDEANYLWYEDPYSDGGVSHHGHLQLKSLISTPLLQGEHVRMLEPNVNFMNSGGTDIIRVDPDFDGGITGAMKIGHAAEGFGMDAEIHNCGPAHRHVMASLRNSNYYEMALVHPVDPATSVPVYEDGYSDDLNSIDQYGCVSVPENPGLGVTYDWTYIEKNRIDSVIYS
ncbi:MAG: enolase C-terminal domain-like protein [SAR202 cluster bacterium]|nr:enolase C-terminal domain-like protein [SAR202 cluster bacterium]